MLRYQYFQTFTIKPMSQCSPVTLDEHCDIGLIVKVWKYWYLNSLITVVISAFLRWQTAIQLNLLLHLI